MIIKHDHYHASSSPEADIIEKEIESELYLLSRLIHELRQRLKAVFRPAQMLTNKWFWSALITSYFIWHIRALSSVPFTPHRRFPFLILFPVLFRRKPSRG